MSLIEKPIKQNGEYKCMYCSRSYKIKENYQKHYVSCEFFHEMQRLNQDERNDMYEKIPDQKQMFQWMKMLAMKCNAMEKEIQILKTQINKKERKQILDYLNSDQNKKYCVSQRFNDWYSDFKIEFCHLEKLFEEDLISGFKAVLEDGFGKAHICPLVCFVQKPNMFYIYEKESAGDLPKWRAMNNEDLDKMMYFIYSRLLKLFVKWQKDNHVLIMNNDKWKEQEIDYMMKINGIKWTNERRNAEIKKWMFGLLQENIETIIEIV